MLTLFPRGGLCNRMRAIVSGLALCESTGKKMYIDWRRKPELNCRFEDLFEKSPMLKLRNDLKFFEKFGPKRLAPKFDLVLPKEEMNFLIDNKYNFDNFKKYRNIYLEAYKSFFDAKEYYTNFKPIEPLQKTIDGYVALFGSNVIGVHIRRTDNYKSIEQSPTTKFIEYMFAEISKCPDIKFFLATDSPDDEECLRKTFGDKIITHQKVLDRNSQRGIQDALVDLMCLSKTKKILGSYWSSFSSVAAEIGDKELFIVSN